MAATDTPHVNTRAMEMIARARQAAYQHAYSTLLAGIAFSPARGESTVAPTTPVVVTAKVGRLTDVRVTRADGARVSGSFDARAHGWRSHEQLAFGSTYQVTATVRAASGIIASSSSSFTTVTPTGLVAATVWPDNGLTVGVGQPIVLRFDRDVDSDAARAAVLAHITLSASKPVAGGWHWFSDRELHFRPTSYWPTGDVVDVRTDLDSWDAGNGLWGQGAVHVRFTIGASHIAVADLATHHMTVTENGKVIADYPFSGGRDKYPTMTGTHIVLDRDTVVHMVSSTNGIPVNSPDGYDEMVYFNVHITDSGEYVHAAPWSVSSQGNSNVSHGCINLAPNDAALFFYFSRVGDVVQVINGPRPPAHGDHGVMDWSSGAQWTPATMVPLS
jgi:lipoprotein-anchoring transpeptidase ErfK/SrfK